MGKIQRRTWLLWVVSAAFICASCGTSESYILPEGADDGYYQNLAQTPHVREQIKESFQSVRRIQSNVTYRTYQFYPEEMPRESEARNTNFEQAAADSKIDNHATAGTAIILSARRGVATLLTASHTVSFPDTIWHYAADQPGEADRFVEAVSVREALHQFIYADDRIAFIELSVNDPIRDLAIMKTVSADEVVDGNLEALAIPAGDSTRLDWTDTIYAVGYPRGVKMITRGTVSRSEHPRRSIVLDISINRGFSGGAVFAVRNDGSGRLEWVGLITSAMGEQETYLAPREIFDEEYNPDIPYAGELFVKTTPRIYYGITHAVDITQIREFFDDNRDDIQRNGLRVPIP